MKSKELVLSIMRQQGRADALALRAQAKDMNGTDLIAQEEKVPFFDPAKDYSEWPIGAPVRDGTQVWTLQQPYNAAGEPGRPENKRDRWSPVHTTDPDKAKPWVESQGSGDQYRKGECCVRDGALWRSKKEKNKSAPGTPGTESSWERIREV